MPTYRDINLEKDEAPAQPSLEELLQRKSEEDEDASLADLDEQYSFSIGDIRDEETTA